MIRLVISLGMGALMAVAQVKSVLGQQLPYEPPDWDDPNCMLDDPWVWEDFGGPIPCSGPFDAPAPTAPDESSAVGPFGIRDAPVSRSEILGGVRTSWSQFEAADHIARSAAPLPPAPREMEFVPPEPLSDLPADDSTLPLGPQEASAPSLGLRFRGAVRADTKSTTPPDGLYPPDTMGAVGPRHFLQVINGFVGVYDKATGSRMSSVTLRAFFEAVGGDMATFDPRVLFDQDSHRWFVIASKVNSPSTNYVAVSVSLDADPLAGWFQFGLPAIGFPDYPTLGVDGRAIYVAVDIADQIWAIDKAPLVAPPPGLGAISSWYATIEGALQPAHTYGDPGAEYLVQTNPPSGLRIFKIGISLAVCNG